MCFENTALVRSPECDRVPTSMVVVTAWFSSSARSCGSVHVYVAAHPVQPVQHHMSRGANRNYSTFRDPHAAGRNASLDSVPLA